MALCAYDAVCVRVPPTFRTALAARVDVLRTSRHGEQGRELADQIKAKLAKWQEPPPAKQKKPLKAPDDVPKKRRGGKRCVSLPSHSAFFRLVPLVCVWPGTAR